MIGFSQGLGSGHWYQNETDTLWHFTNGTALYVNLDTYYYQTPSVRRQSTQIICMERFGKQRCRISHPFYN